MGYFAKIQHSSCMLRKSVKPCGPRTADIFRLCDISGGDASEIFARGGGRVSRREFYPADRITD